MLEVEVTGDIKREGKMSSGFALHCFILFSSHFFFMQFCLKICNLLTVVLGMLSGMAVNLEI